MRSVLGLSLGLALELKLGWERGVKARVGVESQLGTMAVGGTKRQ